MLQAASPLAEEAWMVGFFLSSFLSSDLLTHHGQSSKVEGERMVMDFQDVCATIEDQMAQSNSRLFGTSSQVPTVDPQDNE